MTLQSLWAIGVFTMAAGCAAQPLDGPIDYQVMGGLSGGGDGTAALHIELDGTMTRTPPGGAPQVTTLSAATLRSLRGTLEAADFPSLAETYVQCCDDYEHVVTAELGGTVYTVTASALAAKPARLQRMLDALHDLAAD